MLQRVTGNQTSWGKRRRDGHGNCRGVVRYTRSEREPGQKMEVAGCMAEDYSCLTINGRERERLLGGMEEEEGS